MTKKSSSKGTFIVQILNCQNATWQGTINWVEENKTQPFRSTLELIKLIDGAVGNGEVSSAEEKADPP